MKAYLLTTGTIFALFAVAHLVELVAAWRSLGSDPWFAIGLAAIIVASAALTVWALRLLKAIGR